MSHDECAGRDDGPPGAGRGDGRPKSKREVVNMSAVQVLIDGQGVEVAAVVPWAAWLAVADVARDRLPALFDDLAGGGRSAASDGDIARGDGRSVG